MNRAAIVLAVLVVFALAVANIILGSNLITPLEIAKTRGAGVPFYIVWVMIGLTAGCSIALGGFLLAAMARKK